MQTYLETRNRRVSDAVSGLELKREEWPDYSDEDLLGHFERFQSYDLDSTGFISPENLLEVLKALDVEATMATVEMIISEVAILTGHDNDGSLSFRDYMHCIRYDRSAAAHNEAADAAKEKRLSISEAEPEVGSDSEVAAVSPLEPERVRRSSMSALNSLASSRIRAFQSVVTETSARDKINVFQKKPVVLSGPMVNSDDIHRETLKNKLAAFEVAATYKGHVELKKTWRKVGAGNYASGQKILLGGMPTGVAPKKKISDLP